MRLASPVAFGMPLLVGLLPPVPARAGEPGDFDAAPFGVPFVLAGGAAGPAYAPQVVDGKGDTAADVPAGGAIRVEWRHMRDVYAVRLAFAGGVPRPEDVELKYWRHVWPENGGGGWMKVDDPFHGGYVAAAADVSPAGADALEFRLKPLDPSEIPKVREKGLDYRRTYRILVSFKVAARVAEIACRTDSRWKDAEVKIELTGQEWDGRVEARNARIVSASSPDRSTAVVKVRYADAPDRLSADRGHLVVRRGGKGTDFSFFVDDVVREGALNVRDLQAFVSDASKGLSRAAWKKPADAWDATVMEKVAAMPEQTLEQALKALPAKWLREAPLGLPALRQELFVDERGQLYTEFRSLRSPGPDTDRAALRTRDESKREYRVSTHKNSLGRPNPKNVRRWLEDGWLPVLHATWEDEGIQFHEVALVAALDPKVTRESLALPHPPDRPLGAAPHAANFGSGVRGDEPVAALVRVDIGNNGTTPRDAHLWLRILPAPPLTLEKDGLLVLEKSTKPPAGAGLTPVAGQIDIQERGTLEYLKDYQPPEGKPRDRDSVIHYTVRLPAKDRHSIVLKVPYLEQLSAAEAAQLRAMRWPTVYAEVARLWKARLERAGATYSVPCAELMNFYRANLWHVLISTDRDPPTGLYEHGAATVEYPMYANEAMMVARSLEMRGEHEEARRLIEPYLVSQGARPLPGNFKGQEGLLYAAAPKGFDHYTAQGYNMHHGFLLWAAAEHYLWTRDRKYLEAAAPHLVAACDWITRERQATKVMNPDGSRPLEWGLAPAGDLEDVDEFLYWYPTNAYYNLGMRTAADALAEIGHPEAKRLAADAQEYAEDILASVREAVAGSPVVKLLDGTWVPYVPPRAYVLTDRKEGWIREALYCALHLVDAGLVAPDDPLATWILHDLEDRIFMSPESGYGPDNKLRDPREQFFSWGGFNPQPNLLDNSIAYLKRGQISNFIRAFFNVYAVSVYPDIQCFAEAILSFGEGGGPMYKTPDESKFIQWMRQMLVLEMGGELHLARGVPRAWMEDGKTIEIKDAPTCFGPVSMKIDSAVAAGEVRVHLRLPTRNPPKAVRVSLRHPEAKPIKSVMVDGHEWKDFVADAGVVTLPGTAGAVAMVVTY